LPNTTTEQPPSQYQSQQAQQVQQSQTNTSDILNNQVGSDNYNNKINKSMPMNSKRNKIQRREKNKPFIRSKGYINKSSVINKLIILADKLDNYKYKRTADKVDKLIELINNE